VAFVCVVSVMTPPGEQKPPNGTFPNPITMDCSEWNTRARDEKIVCHIDMWHGHMAGGFPT
jgi:hypothetical protein